MPCDRDPSHIHNWPTQGQLTIYHCERQCGFCDIKTAQCSHLRAHVKELHLKQYPLLELLPGRMGNAGKYPTDRHRPRKKAVRAQHAAASAAGKSAASTYLEQLPLPGSPANMTEQSLHCQTKDIGPITTGADLQQVPQSPGWVGQQQEQPAMGSVLGTSTVRAQDIPQPLHDTCVATSERHDDARDLGSTSADEIYSHFMEQANTANSYWNDKLDDGFTFGIPAADSYDHFIHPATIQTTATNIASSALSYYPEVSDSHYLYPGATATSCSAGLRAPDYTPAIPYRSSHRGPTPVVQSPNPMQIEVPNYGHASQAPPDQLKHPGDAINESSTEGIAEMVQSTSGQICPEVIAQEEINLLMVQMHDILSKALATGASIDNLRSHVELKVQETIGSAMTKPPASDKPDI
ncbi:hypothetical protein HDK90DRAFT_37975 [Phyllosticta capitalensis]|uniref:C2H2-type domain-containing protein n=1 Tax=Phyllosticta capitalensis TaxID=121624 RepID=A0ABR1Z4I0_9PEZI